MRKRVWLLSIIAMLSLVNCGGGSEEAKELLQKILQLVGIPQNIVVNVCQDANRDGVCGEKELQAKVTINKGDSVDDIWRKITQSEDGQYFLETYDETLPILLIIKDTKNLSHDGAEITIPFNGFTSQEQNETKELSVLQSMEDAGYLSTEETKALKETPNREVVDRVFFASLEHNYNLLRDENLSQKVSTDKVLEVMAEELKKVDIEKELPAKIISCEDNSSCIQEIVTSTSQELNITKEEAEVIAEEVKRESRHIADGYIVKLNSAVEVQCDGDIYHSILEVGAKGEIIFENAKLDSSCQIVVPSDAIIDSNNNGQYDNTDKAIGFVMRGKADGTFVTPLTTLLLAKKAKGEDISSFETMVKDFNPVSAASAVGLYTGEKKKQIQKLMMLMEVLKTSLKEGADASAIDLTQILSNISFEEMDMDGLLGGLSSSIKEKVTEALKLSGVIDLIKNLDKFDSSKINLNTLMVNVSDGEENLSSAILEANKISNTTPCLKDVLKSEVDVEATFGVKDTPVPTPTVTPMRTPEPTPMPTPTPTPIESTAVTFTSTLKKTGQTVSHAAYDDGEYQIGRTPSYSRSGEIVTDSITGLEWQDDANSSNTELNWEDAKSHCLALSLGGQSDWRLPTRKELKSIVDYGKVDPAMDSVFQNVTSNFYWSSTTSVSDSSGAWFVMFYGGNDTWSDKMAEYRVRCVRGGQ